MTFDIALTLTVAIIAVILFVTEKYRVDMVAALTMTALLVSGIITPEQGISGFSNPATVTVAAMFVLSAGLHRTGVLDNAAQMLLRLGRGSPTLTALCLMVLVGFISAFVNNTAAVAIFLPVTIELARKCKTSPSKLLIPLSFASLFGGICTLLGTSTNILVSSIATKHHLKPLGMFEMAPLGLVFAACGILYMMLVGIPLLPSTRGPEDLEDDFDLAPYMSEIVLEEESSSCYRTLLECPLIQQMDLDVIEVRRANRTYWNPSPDFVLMPGDLLKVRCVLQDLISRAAYFGVTFKNAPELDQDRVLVEAVLSPNSSLAGHSLRTFEFRERYKASVLALRRAETVRHSKLADVRLRAGDVLVLAAHRDSINLLRRHPSFVLVNEFATTDCRYHLMATSILIVGTTVALAAFNVLPLVVSALLGCALLLLTGCLNPDEAYDAIDWKVVVVLGGMLTLGTAMEETGAAKLVAGSLLYAAGDYGPWVALSALYLLTSLLTECLSNNATAVLLVPIAILTAKGLHADPRPFLLAIAFAASASFMTPVGYQTNTLVHGPGRYRFTDFLKVGVPLNLLFWILASVLIPRFWPF